MRGGHHTRKPLSPKGFHLRAHKHVTCLCESTTHGNPQRNTQCSPWGAWQNTTNTRLCDWGEFDKTLVGGEWKNFLKNDDFGVVGKYFHFFVAISNGKYGNIPYFLHYRSATYGIILWITLWKLWITCKERNQYHDTWKHRHNMMQWVANNMKSMTTVAYPYQAIQEKYVV